MEVIDINFWVSYAIYSCHCKGVFKIQATGYAFTAFMVKTYHQRNTAIHGVLSSKSFKNEVSTL